MAWLQAIIIVLNRTRLARGFERIYALGLRLLVARLTNHPAVFCVFGCGSYFDGRPVYGLSDIDLIIVLRESVQRFDAAPGEIAHLYEGVRRFFPFLGRWHEKEGSLIFLSDVRAGLPIPESFRIRYKQGRLVPVCGEHWPDDLICGPVTTSEAITEIDTLVRLPLVEDSRHTRQLVFWKRIFAKVIALADMLDLPHLATEARAHPLLAFMRADDTTLFVRARRPDRLFAALLSLARQICEAIQSREPRVPVRLVPASRRADAPIAAPTDPPCSAALALLERHGHVTLKMLPSIPLGLMPRLLYFPIDKAIPLAELHEDAYTGVHRVRRALLEHGTVDENLLLSADGCLFIATRQATYVDVVPLDCLQFANVYAAAHTGSLDFEMPAGVLAEQQAMAEGMFRALAHLYRTHDGHVTKLSYPCIYREDDADVIENALRILRVRLASGSDRLLFHRSRDMLDHLGQRYPESQEVVRELARYWRYVLGDRDAEPVANNVYRCLHQLVWQVLSGAERLTLDSPHQHLGITVGVITRNRARDLAEMLESLTRQRRQPDEVLVVDNGSTDDTPAVIERFHDRLPIRCRLLAEPGIPQARNLVIEEAAHDIVSFIDDDCISEPTWLEAVERGFLRADNVGIVGGWVRHEPAAQPSSVDNYYRVFHHTKS